MARVCVAGWTPGQPCLPVCAWRRNLVATSIVDAGHRTVRGMLISARLNLGLAELRLIPLDAPYPPAIGVP